jgi:hypothetical protein
MRGLLFQPCLASIQDLIKLFGQHLNQCLFFVVKVVNPTGILKNGYGSIADYCHFASP